METKTFTQWLYESEREEALRDFYFGDQIGPGSDFLDWAESVYKAMQRPVSANEPRNRSWPFTK